MDVTAGSSPGWMLWTGSGQSVRVPAPNWMIAFGVGLQRLGITVDFKRLIFRRSHAQTFYIEDVLTGQRFMICPV